MAEFFLTGTKGEQAEEMYADLARRVGKPVPPLHERIEAITWAPGNDEEWTARVGAQLRGVRIQKRRRRGETVKVTTPLSDRATVLAIFAGQPFFVWTDARPITAKLSAWGNPLMASSSPLTVSRFEIGQ